MKCSRCNIEMYFNSYGNYECRNFDCPPGTEAWNKKGWELIKKYRVLLRRLNSSKFTVAELKIILSDNFAAIEGYQLEVLAKREHLE